MLALHGEIRGHPEPKEMTMNTTETLDRAGQTTADEFALPAPDDCDADLLESVAKHRRGELTIGGDWQAGWWGSGLFAYVRPNFLASPSGCLTMIRRGSGVAYGDPALTDAIRRDAAIPDQVFDIRPEHLMRFAQWQTLIRRRYAARAKQT